MKIGSTMLETVPGRLLRILCALQIMITYLVSSLFVNVLQIVAWSCIFLPKRQRAAMSARVTTLWQDLPLFLVTKLGGVKVVMKGDPDFSMDGNECGLMVANHSLGLDFCGVLVTTHWLGLDPGAVHALMKRSLAVIPAIGWVMYLNGSLFLSRHYKRDKLYIERRVREICESYPRPFWVGIYPEGTRITDEKRTQSQEFSKERGLPVLNNVLMPRTKGISIMIEQCRKLNIETIFNMTFAYEGGEIYLRDFMSNGRFKTRAVHVYCEREPIKSVPQDDVGLRDWLIESFVQKDKRMDYFNEHQTLPGKPVTPRIAHDCTTGYVLWTVVTAFVALYSNAFAPWQFAAWLALVLMGVSSSPLDDESSTSSLSSSDVVSKTPSVSDVAPSITPFSPTSPLPTPSDVVCSSTTTSVSTPPATTSQAAIVHAR